MYRSVLGIYFFIFGSPISLPVCTVQCKHFKKENTNEKKKPPSAKKHLIFTGFRSGCVTYFSIEMRV